MVHKVVRCTTNGASGQACGRQKNTRESLVTSLHGCLFDCAFVLRGQDALDFGQASGEHGQILRCVVLQFVDNAVRFAGGNFGTVCAALQEFLPKATNFAGQLNTGAGLPTVVRRQAIDGGAEPDEIKAGVKLSAGRGNLIERFAGGLCQVNQLEDANDVAAGGEQGFNGLQTL